MYTQSLKSDVDNILAPPQLPEVHITLFYERIVKNGAGNGCGTASLKFRITFILRYSTMKQKLILI